MVCLMVRAVDLSQDFTPDCIQHTTLLPVTVSLILTTSLTEQTVLVEEEEEEVEVSSTPMDTTTCLSQSF